jgi:TonB family protein
VKLSKNARLRPAIRKRWAAVLIAIPPSVLLCFLAPSSTVASGRAQFSHLEQKCVIRPTREAGQQNSLSQSQSQEGASIAPKTSIPTHENLQLTLKADCGNVEVFTDVQNEVSYRVRLDPKTAAEPEALRRNLSLTGRETPRGVVLIGPSGREGDCRDQPTYEIHVPRRYDLDIAVRSGDIAIQDVDGVVTLSTEGGNIRVGTVGTHVAAPKGFEGRTFTARLETGGGDISVRDVAGGLRAATGDGQISAADVYGPAVLRTGGGDIHVGHVFGVARFNSGGGDITVLKVDGGLWADTAGGRIEIGNAARLGAMSPNFPAGEKEAFLADVTRLSHEQQDTPAIAESMDVTEFARLFDALVWGGIRVEPADQQKRLVNAIAPDYPDVARLAGIEGEVTLHILVGRDGTIRGIAPLSGSPVLARAAMHAVEQWRYVPALVEGHPVNVVSTVTLAFRLHP